MPDIKAIALAKLKQLLLEAERIGYDMAETEEFKRWRLATETAIEKLCGEKSRYTKDFSIVSWSPGVLYEETPEKEWRDAFLDGMRDARAIIGAVIQEAEDYEMGTFSATDSTARGLVAAKAFIVHGHDNEMKETVARFLERLGIQPVILHEQASRGDTIVEKIERNTDIALAIVLLSPDDVGAAQSEATNLQPRARQNVILELGYFVGKLTRRRVVPILRSKLELPSDVLGVTYISFDSGEWKLQIIRELKALNIAVDANKAF